MAVGVPSGLTGKLVADAVTRSIQVKRIALQHGVEAAARFVLRHAPTTVIRSQQRHRQDTRLRASLADSSKDEDCNGIRKNKDESFSKFARMKRAYVSRGECTMWNTLFDRIGHAGATHLGLPLYRVTLENDDQLKDACGDRALTSLLNSIGERLCNLKDKDPPMDFAAETTGLVSEAVDLYNSAAGHPKRQSPFVLNALLKTIRIGGTPSLQSQVLVTVMDVMKSTDSPGPLPSDDGEKVHSVDVLGPLKWLPAAPDAVTLTEMTMIARRLEGKRLLPSSVSIDAIFDLATLNSDAMHDSALVLSMLCLMRDSLHQQKGDDNEAKSTKKAIIPRVHAMWSQAQQALNATHKSRSRRFSDKGDPAADPPSKLWIHNRQCQSAFMEVCVGVGDWAHVLALFERVILPHWQPPAANPTGKDVPNDSVPADESEAVYNPADSLIFAMATTAYNRLGRPEKALAAYTRLQTSRPNAIRAISDARLIEALMRSSLACNAPARAISLFACAFDRDPPKRNTKRRVCAHVPSRDCLRNLIRALGLLRGVRGGAKGRGALGACPPQWLALSTEPDPPRQRQILRDWLSAKHPAVLEDFDSLLEYFDAFSKRHSLRKKRTPATGEKVPTLRGSPLRSPFAKVQEGKE